MSPDTKPPKRPRIVALSEDAGAKLVELATGHGLSVADYFDREFGEPLAEKWRAMLEAKLLATSKAGA